MKPSYYLLLAIIIGFILPVSCKKTQPVDQLSLLPPATTTGANTFGCLVNGTALVAKDASNLGQWCFTCGNFSPAISTQYDNFDSIENALEVYNSNANGMDNKSPTAFYLNLHFVHLYNLSNRNYNWQDAQDFGANGYGYYFNNYLEGEFYVDSLKGYAWFDSYNGSGKTNITKCDTALRIISGTFSGILRIRNGAKTITLTDGRFDVKW